MGLIINPRYIGFSDTATKLHKIAMSLIYNPLRIITNDISVYVYDLCPHQLYIPSCEDLELNNNKVFAQWPCLYFIFRIHLPFPSDRGLALCQSI
jgi:hypothetical protein